MMSTPQDFKSVFGHSATLCMKGVKPFLLHYIKKVKELRSKEITQYFPKLATSVYRFFQISESKTYFTC